MKLVTNFLYNTSFKTTFGRSASKASEKETQNAQQIHASPAAAQSPVQQQPVAQAHVIPPAAIQEEIVEEVAPQVEPALVAEEYPVEQIEQQNFAEAQAPSVDESISQQQEEVVMETAQQVEAAPEAIQYPPEQIEQVEQQNFIEEEAPVIEEPIPQQQEEVIVQESQPSMEETPIAPAPVQQPIVNTTPSNAQVIDQVPVQKRKTLRMPTNLLPPGARRNNNQAGGA